jgi:hypothetical protein
MKSIKIDFEDLKENQVVLYMGYEVVITKIIDIVKVYGVVRNGKYAGQNIRIHGDSLERYNLIQY